MSTKVTWLGHAALSLETDGFKPGLLLSRMQS